MALGEITPCLPAAASPTSRPAPRSDVQAQARRRATELEPGSEGYPPDLETLAYCLSAMVERVIWPSPTLVSVPTGMLIYDGVEPDAIPVAFNIFMNVPVAADGSIRVLPPSTRAGDHIELRALAERLGAPVVTTWNGKGAIDETHPLAGQTIGYVGSTGNASADAPHLHFGIYSNGPADPYPFIHKPRERPSDVRVDTSRLGQWTRPARQSLTLRATPDRRAVSARLSIGVAIQRCSRLATADASAIASTSRPTTVATPTRSRAHRSLRSRRKYSVPTRSSSLTTGVTTSKNSHPRMVAGGGAAGQRPGSPS